MRAYAGARGPKVLGLRMFGGVSTHVTLTGVFTWLLVVGVAELAVVAVELSFRLLKFVVVNAWAATEWFVKQVRAHRRAVVEQSRRISAAPGGME